MINEYLDFAKGDGKEGAKSTRIKDFLERIISYYKKLGREIDYKFDLTSEFTMEVKRSNLQRAVRNLIDNAFNHATKVNMTAEITGGRFRIMVDDNGSGIPKSERQNIFKPFYRIDNSRNLDKTGAGLGLSIVMDVVKSHGGRVEAEDSPMGGLRIIINLPI
jgi:two-component system osmolarity sensor histidine kinase EnvZ